MLELTEIKKTYSRPEGSVRALDGVTVGVEAGEFVVVQGASGCGKTTLLLTAGTLLRPDSGEVRIGGEDPYRMSPEARAALRATRIGFVFQQFHLVPYLDVLENVMVAAAGDSSSGTEAGARGLIERFGLKDRVHHVPAELSTGERQRTALARALLNDPGLVLADEPTGNLDEENSRTVLEHLAEFAAGGGAVLLVTHDLQAAEYGSRSLRMEKGELV